MWIIVNTDTALKVKHGNLGQTKFLYQSNYKTYYSVFSEGIISYTHNLSVWS